MKRIILLTAVLLIASDIYAQLPSWLPTDSLVVWYPFNGNANDESGNGLNATVFGATLTTGHSGIPNSAYSFNGSSDYLLSHDIDLDSAFTLLVWVYPISNVGSLISRYGWSNESYELIYSNVGAGIYAHVGSNSDSNNTVLSWDLLVFNDWQLAALVYDYPVAQLYLNTNIVGSKNNMNLTHNNDDLVQIGKSVWGGNLLNGKLDNMAIYRRALTRDEIVDYYLECVLNITVQPSDTTVLMGNNAAFYTSASDTTALYQWQADTGTGFIDIVDTAAFSGVNTSVLNITGATLSMDNYLFRCVITLGACIDTTSTGTLSVYDDTHVNSLLYHETTIFPNPATSDVTITNKNYVLGTHYFLSDISGRQILKVEVTREGTIINLSGFSEGVYFLNNDFDNKIYKIIKN